MSIECEVQIIKFKQGETAEFRLHLKKRVSGNLTPWEFPDVDADIATLTLTVPGLSTTPVIFDFNNTVDTPVNEAITFASTSDRKAGIITVILDKVKTATVLSNDEDCFQNMEAFVNQTLGGKVMCKYFAFIEKLDVGKSLFAI